MGFTFHGHDLDHLSETSQYKLFRHSWSERPCLTIYLPSNPGHPVSCTLGNVDTISLSQTLNMNLTSAILLLVRFLTMFKLCVFVLCVYAHIT